MSNWIPPLPEEELHSQVAEPHPTPGELHRDVMDRTLTAGLQFKRVVGGLGILVALGVVGFIIKAANGFDDRSDWGYYAAIFAFLFTTTQSALLVSISMRMVKTHWRRPLARVSELFAVVGVANLLIFIPLLWLLPPLEGRATIWFEWPWGAPKLLDTLSMVFLVLNGLVLLWVSSIPDLAAAAHSYTGARKSLAHMRSPWQCANGWDKLFPGLNQQGADA